MKKGGNLYYNQLSFLPFLVQRNENNFIIGEREFIVKNDPFKISLFKHDCIPQPELYLSTTWIQLGIITFFLIISGLFSGLLTQFKILVSTSFYPDAEIKRIHYLHTKLLKKRAKLQQKTAKNVFARTVSHHHEGKKSPSLSIIARFIPRKYLNTS